jgi:hypothetical protein
MVNETKKSPPNQTFAWRADVSPLKSYRTPRIFSAFLRPLALSSGRRPAADHGLECRIASSALFGDALAEKNGDLDAMNSFRQIFSIHLQRSSLGRAEPAAIGTRFPHASSGGIAGESREEVEEEP